MSIIDRLEEAIINASIAALADGPSVVSIPQDDARRIHAVITMHRINYSLDETETPCAECEELWPCKTARWLQPDSSIYYRTPDERSAEAAEAFESLLRKDHP